MLVNKVTNRVMCFYRRAEANGCATIQLFADNYEQASSYALEHGLEQVFIDKQGVYFNFVWETIERRIAL